LEIEMSKSMNVLADDSNPGASVGVQSWSRGDIFPAIISRVETYSAPMDIGHWQAISPVPGHDQARRMYRQYREVFFGQDIEDRRVSTKFVLSQPGKPDAYFATYDAAHDAAAGDYDLARFPDAWVSKQAYVAESAQVEQGACIAAGAIISDNAVIRFGAIVRANAFIGEYAVLRDYAVVGASATIGDEAYIGEHARVGKFAIVGFGARIGGGAHVPECHRVAEYGEVPVGDTAK